MPYLLYFIILLPFLFSCQGLENTDVPPEELHLLSWNVQNLFDGESNGNEYSEFDPDTGKWSQDLYELRLENLSTFLNSQNKLHNFDILALQEIENAEVLTDLESYLNVSYPYRITFGGSDFSIRSGVLSKFPISKTIVHEVGYIGNIPLRPILEVQIEFSHQQKEIFALFISHWKSRSGGVASTERYRREASKIIRRRSEEIERLDRQNSMENWYLIVTGDLNENWDEELREPDLETALSLSPHQELLQITSEIKDNKEGWFFTPWEGSNHLGSYEFREEWNTLDHFLLNSNLTNNQGYEYKQFLVLNNDVLFLSNGSINKWASYYQDGYSDHLPIVLKLEYLNTSF